MFAGGSVLGPAVLTSEYKINYLRPTRGETLVARASVVNAGRRQAVCRCEVFTTGAGRKETFCAPAQGTSVSAPAPREAASRTFRIHSSRPSYSPPSQRTLAFC
jgi:acyl-coenzyme A thioesterase PaaI-like protein